MHENRPSYHELGKRLNEAKGVLKKQFGLFANLSKASGELTALGIGDSNEVWLLIKDLLEEITPEDYVGTKPPQRCYEKSAEGLELFAFSWWSPKLIKNMYIKFVLKNERYYYISLHQSRSEKTTGGS